MSDPFIAEIKIVSFDFPPRGWASCNGQTLPINLNQALFSLLGTTYGGNGQTTFQLPNLQGRSPLHFGQGFQSNRQLGEVGGEEIHTLNQSEMPAHNHVVSASTIPGTQASPANTVPAARRGGYAESGNVSMSPASIGGVGGSQAHNNLAPYSVVNFCIALVGIFPSRN
jgi:microcystin-dependent protein